MEPKSDSIVPLDQQQEVIGCNGENQMEPLKMVDRNAQNVEERTKDCDIVPFSCAEEGLASRIGLVERGIEGAEERGFPPIAVKDDVEGPSYASEDIHGHSPASVDAVDISSGSGNQSKPIAAIECRGLTNTPQSNHSCNEEANTPKLDHGNDTNVTVPKENVANCAREGMEGGTCREAVENGLEYGFGCDDGVYGSKCKKRKLEEGGRRKRNKAKRRLDMTKKNHSSSSSLSSDEEEDERTQSRTTGKESEDEQQFCLRWNNFLANITSQFGSLRDDEDFVDVTLACGGMHVKAHRVVLSACSPYFKRIFKSVPYCPHPVVFLEGIQPAHLLSLLAFMYCGEVGVRRGQLPSLLSAAQVLQIRGLTEMGPTGSSQHSGEDDDEEKVVLSARRQAKAVEKVLKDIGFSEAGVEQSGGNKIKLSGTDGSTQGCKRQPRWDNDRRAARDHGSSGKENGPEMQHHLLGNHLNSTTAVVKGLVKDEGIIAVLGAPRVCHATQSPTPLPNMELETSGCSKEDQSDCVMECKAVTKHSIPKVNSHHPDNPCGIAASLVDVCLGSPVAGEMMSDSGLKGRSSQMSSDADDRVRSIVQTSWDPGEGESGPLGPSVVSDLGAQQGIMKPKEEMDTFGSDVEEMSHVVEPKRERLELSSADESISCGATLIAGSSVSLISKQDQPYRPHILGSPITSSLQLHQQQQHQSRSSSHIPFLVPQSSTVNCSSVIPTPGSPGVDGMVRGGHLKWEMPRPCPVCRRIYSNNSNLRRHLRTIHEDYYERHMK